MNEYNVSSDECVDLYNDGDKTRLCSFGLYGFYGSPGSGKTYAMTKVAKSYVEQANKSTYDILNPTLCNGPITHDFYISPSIKSDATMKHNHGSTLFIEIDDKKMQILTQFIQDLAKETSDIIQYQLCLLTGSEQLDIKRQQKAIQAIEHTKKTHPELRFKYDSKIMTDLYQKFGLQYDGFLVRRQKIMIRFDDYQGTKLTNESRNEFYRLMTTKRHLGIWFTGMVFHTFSNATENLRTLQNMTILFQGILFSQVKDMFAEMPKHQTDSFGVDEFADLYKNLARLEKYNFIGIESQPSVYLGISWGQNLIQ